MLWLSSPGLRAQGLLIEKVADSNSNGAAKPCA